MSHRSPKQIKERSIAITTNSPDKTFISEIGMSAAATSYTWEKCAKCGSSTWHEDLDGKVVCEVCGFIKEDAALQHQPENYAWMSAMKDIATAAGTTPDEKCFEMVELLSVELAEKEDKVMLLDEKDKRIKELEKELAKTKREVNWMKPKVVRAMATNDELDEKIGCLPDDQLTDFLNYSNTASICEKFAQQCFAHNYYGKDVDLDCAKSKLACDLCAVINDCHTSNVSAVVDTDEMLDYVGFDDELCDVGAMRLSLPHKEYLEQMEGAADEQDIPISSVELLMGRREYLRLFGEKHETRDFWIVWEC